MKETFQTLAKGALDEIGGILAGVNDGEIAQLLEAMRAAGRIFFAGAGRSRLMVACTAMRFMQLGAEASLVGEVTAPAITGRDLLVIVSGSGETPSMTAMAVKARRYGARVAAVTGNRASTLAEQADVVVALKTPSHSRQIGAASFEQSILVLGDTLASLFARLMGIDDPETAMRSRHANLE